MVVDLLIVRDNATRWNSTYILIHRALKLKPRIIIYILDNIKELNQDNLLENNWEELSDIKRILVLFQSVIKGLEGHVVHREYRLV